jgi:threonine dehydrogenase-like Zn-dependent dehydrogenase
MTGRVLAATTIGALKTEIREYPFPEISPDAGILKIEAAGVCGSDWQAYQSDRPARIMGHENVGRIYRLGPLAARRWGLSEGDRVALEEYLPCGHCSLCRTGEFRLCDQTEARRPGALRYGTTPITEKPGLWGGYSQYQYLHPESVFHKVPEDVPAELAAMCLPIGNGMQWTYLDGRAGPGKTVLIQGPGQQGLACLIAAKAAGADWVIVSGLSVDKARLEIARAMGADEIVEVDDAAQDDLEDRVLAATQGRGVDISIDTAGGANTLVKAMRLTRKNGLVLFGVAPSATSPEFQIGNLLAGRLTLKPCRGHSYESVELALKYIASRRFPLHLMATHRFGLKDVDVAVRSVGGQGAPGAVHVTVLPWS